MIIFLGLSFLFLFLFIEFSYFWFIRYKVSKVFPVMANWIFPSKSFLLKGTDFKSISIFSSNSFSSFLFKSPSLFWFLLVLSDSSSLSFSSISCGNNTDRFVTLLFLFLLFNKLFTNVFSWISSLKFSIVFQTNFLLIFSFSFSFIKLLSYKFMFKVLFISKLLVFIISLFSFWFSFSSFSISQ